MNEASTLGSYASIEHFQVFFFCYPNFVDGLFLLVQCQGGSSMGEGYANFFMDDHLSVAPFSLFCFCKTLAT